MILMSLNLKLRVPCWAGLLQHGILHMSVI